MLKGKMTNIEIIMGLIILGFSVILIVLLTLIIYSKFNKKSDDKIIEKFTEKFTKIEGYFSKMESMQEDVVDFKNLFTNKTERGKLGEDWLEDIIKDVISQRHYKRQHTFSNGKRVDFLLDFGSPEERISIDSKFTWENYKKTIEEKDVSLKKQYGKNFTEDINKHINDVSEYIISGETAPIALMFVASEGVFRAIEESSQNFVKKARAKNIIIVSPNTIFACLKTYKLLIQNKEMYEMSNMLQKEVGILGEDVTRLIDRFSTLGDRQEKVSEDYKKLKTSMDKIANRSEKIKNLDLEDVDKITKKK